uniref:WGS project CAEQ00000000 data, annotated contig 14 n=1 Tax=Trypanosoma congolense (strain IL3000) TaxID=1068625 RepID=F9W6M2_TRYCI|nr:unnamed protein product [Trypanosoma congolense IL3000]
MAVLPLQCQGVRKRGREEGGHPHECCNAYFSCGDWHSYVVLNRPVKMIFEKELFPGIDFFFSPCTTGVMNTRPVFALCTAATPCDRLFGRRPWRPCRVHGPFRCSCHVIECATRHVIQLERELLRPGRKVEVVYATESHHSDVSFFQLDSSARSVSLVLCGLPLPSRHFGPLELLGVDTFSSVSRAIASAEEKRVVSETATPKCVLCSLCTVSACCICRCTVCPTCGMVCSRCGRGGCRACVVVENSNSLNESCSCFDCFG